MALNWKEGEIRQRLSNLIDHVIETAFQDEIISPDEEALIEVIRQGVRDLETQMKQMIQRQISLEQAEQEIREMFERVLSQAAQTAKNDGTITADELLIIDRLAKYIRNEDIAEYID
jgi:hypothetical protein